MTAKKISSGLYRISDNDILFRKSSRCLRMTGHNRRGGATKKCSTWVLCRIPSYTDADVREHLEITGWRRGPGHELQEFDTKREALEALEGAELESRQ